MTQAVHWRCFHCGDTFTKAQEKHARKHFGRDEGEQPVCLIRSAGEDALLSALRNAQDQLERYRLEDSDLMRAMWALRSDHARRVRQAEEEGYAKGLRDVRATHDVAKEVGSFVRAIADANGFTKAGDSNG